MVDRLRAAWMVLRNSHYVVFAGGADMAVSAHAKQSKMAAKISRDHLIVIDSIGGAGHPYPGSPERAVDQLVAGGVRPGNGLPRSG